MEIHWIAGLVLTMSIVYHIIHASFWLDFWSIWLNKEDVTEAIARFKRAMGRSAPAPRKAAKYPWDNKMYHTAIVLSALAVGADRAVHDEARGDAALRTQSVPVQRRHVGRDVRPSRADRASDWWD